MCRKQKNIFAVKNEEQLFTLQKSGESFIALQKSILRNRRFYCTARSFTTLQKVLLHYRRFYYIVGSFTTQQKSRSCGRNWRKIPSVAKTEDKLTLQHLSWDFGLNVCTQTGNGRMVLQSPFCEALDLTFFLEKAQTKRYPIISRRMSKV